MTPQPSKLGLSKSHMGGCQNYGPLLGILNIKCRIIIGIPKGTIILTSTTHMIAVVFFIWDSEAPLL